MKTNAFCCFAILIVMVARLQASDSSFAQDGQRLFTDIGVVTQSGTLQTDGGGITLSAAGSGLGLGADSFSFLFETVGGDGEITACISTPKNSSNGCSGIMFRDSLASDANYVALVSGTDGTLTLSARPLDDSQNGNAGAKASGGPFVKLERRANEFRAYLSNDGSNWTLFAQRTVQLGRQTPAGVFAFGNGASTATLSTVAYSFLEINALPLSGLTLWLRADLVSADNANKHIGLWRDQSGMAHDAVQSDAAHQPSSISNNGDAVPVVRFDGRNDFLNLGNFMENQMSGELLVVFNLAQNAAGPQGLWTLGKNNLGTSFDPGSKTVLDDFGLYLQKNFSCDLVSTPGVRLYDVASEQGLWSMQLDGQTQLATDNSAVGFSSSARLGVNGHGLYLHGDIQEVLVYDHVLNNQERLSLTRYFANQGVRMLEFAPLSTSGGAGQVGTPASLSGSSSLSVGADSSTTLVNSNGNQRSATNARIYVNNRLGDDQRDGKQNSAVGSTAGPKKTLDAAVAALTQGGEIVIQGTSSEYDLSSIDVSNRSITITPIGDVTIGKNNNNK